MATNNESTATMSSNDNYTNVSALMIRLDTRPILDDFELFLRGKRQIVHKNSDGSYKIESINVGKRKANDLGIQALVNRVCLILNTAIVQGNYKLEKYNFEISQIRQSIATTLMVNLYKWGIEEDDYQEIIDSIMTAIKAFLSRLIENKERDSYDKTLRTFESSSINDNSKSNFGFVRGQ